MVFKRANASGVQRKGINKLTLGFASLAAAAVIGTTGLVAAQTPTTSKPTKDQCAQMGFTNYGQCVSQWAKTHGQNGNGYGGNNNTINVGVDVHQSGSHNVINIILNLFQ